MSLRTGDRIDIEAFGQHYDGKVFLASANGRALMLQFDAIIAGHAGMMPVLQGEDGAFHALIGPTQTPITITRHGG